MYYCYCIVLLVRKLSSLLFGTWHLHWQTHLHIDRFAFAFLIPIHHQDRMNRSFYCSLSPCSLSSFFMLFSKIAHLSLCSPQRAIVISTQNGCVASVPCGSTSTLPRTSCSTIGWTALFLYCATKPQLIGWTNTTNQEQLQLPSIRNAIR